MVMLELTPIKEEIDEDDIVHIICCDDLEPTVSPLIAFCGLDVTNERRVPDSTELTCVVCIDLSRNNTCAKLNKECPWL